MAGERLAQQYIYCTPEILNTGDWIDIWLAGYTHRFTAFKGGSTPNQPLYGQIPMNVGQANGVEISIEAARLKVQQRIDSLGLPYTTRELRGGFGNMMVGFIIEATLYDPTYNFPFPTKSSNTNGWGWNSQPIDTIRPVFVDQAVVNAGIFGSATGAISLVARNGTNGVYSFTWSDGVVGDYRPNLRAGRYVCVVADSSGASTSVTLQVLEDSQLTVVADKRENDVTLLVTGGVPAYTYAWADGPTTRERLNLAVGSYSCTVMDARGATAEVSVTIVSFQCYFVKNPILLPLDAGNAYRANPASKPNLTFVVEVWIEPEYLSEEFVRIGDPIEQPADRNGRTEFEVQVLLDAYLQEHLPALNQSLPTRADSLFKRFYLKSRQRYGNPVVNGLQTTQEQNYVLLGGLDYYEYATRTWFNTYQSAVKPFLTWQPDNKRVYADQPEYLYFMVDTFDLVGFKLAVQVNLSNGTKEEFVTHLTEEPSRFEVYCLPVGYAALALFRYDSFDRRVRSWSVQVLSATGVPLSEMRRYVLEYRYAAQKRYFLYTNSLGGVDTLACVGDAKGTLTPTQEEAERSPSPHYSPLEGDTMVLDSAGALVLNVNTGLLSRAGMAQLQELVLSKRVTMQREGFYWPGKVKPKALEAYNEADTARTYEFDFVMPRQRLFTPRLPVLTAADTVPVRAGEGGQP